MFRLGLGLWVPIAPMTVFSRDRSTLDMVLAVFCVFIALQILSLTYAFLDSVGKDQEARRHLGVLLLLPALYAQLIPRETERSTT
jgi:hypothetical protein